MFIEKTKIKEEEAWISPSFKNRRETEKKANRQEDSNPGHQDMGIRFYLPQPIFIDAPGKKNFNSVLKQILFQNSGADAEDATKRPKSKKAFFINILMA